MFNAIHIKVYTNTKTQNSLVSGLMHRKYLINLKITNFRAFFSKGNK
jgi:hypothetical protein